MGVQVQSATKYINEEGKLIPLSILKRQFISFSYGGKNIEDFDLLAIFSNDRLDKEIYAPFNDTTTEQAELDGQMFWQSNFKAGQLSFTLATDGMTSVQLEEFKNWFQPGIEKELILSEHHNRGILARVSDVPQISLLPFEKEIMVQIGNKKYPTKTSLYKGEIKLNFVMDDPYWYSLASKIDDLTLPENLKKIYEDGIPHLEMFSLDEEDQRPIFLADNNYFNLSNSSIVISNIEGLQQDALLYYCGTAAEKPEISFYIPIILKDGLYSFKGLTSSAKATLSLDGGATKLEFTLPSLLSSCNTAIDIINNFKGTSILDLRRELRDSIYNYYSRSYIMAAIDSLKNGEAYKETGSVDSDFIAALKGHILNFFDLDKNLFCNINCKTGKVIISGAIRAYGSSEPSKTITENAGNMIKSNYLTIETRKLPKDGKITSEECLMVETNSELSNLIINYKYKYL